MRRAAAAAMALCACSQEAAPEAPAIALDCARPFAAQAAAIAAAPGLKAAPAEPGEPYRFYNAADGRTSYLVTEPAAPAHPAILKQAALRTEAGLEMKTTGCAFGDRQAYAALVAYLEGLGGGR